MDEQRLLTADEVRNIPDEDLPLLVVSYGIGSPISTAIVGLRGGNYNHLMYYATKGHLASQGATFCDVPIDEYLKRHTMKFITNINWTAKDKADILDAIRKDLTLPFYRRWYDIVGCVSQMTRFTKWIHVPWLSICSDYGRYLAIYDKHYKLKLPTPSEVNEYTKTHREIGYRVRGRYRPD